MPPLNSTVRPHLTPSRKNLLGLVGALVFGLVALAVFDQALHLVANDAGVALWRGVALRVDNWSGAAAYWLVHAGTAVAVAPVGLAFGLLPGKVLGAALVSRWFMFLLGVHIAALVASLAVAPGSFLEFLSMWYQLPAFWTYLVAILGAAAWFAGSRPSRAA